MKRTMIIASHHTMADGLKDTLDFISGGVVETVALSAYMDNSPIEDTVTALMSRFEADDEVIVLTDLTNGSVNQKFFTYRNRPHTHIISGMSLPLALLIAMEPQDEYLAPERIREIVEESRGEMKYVNEISDDGDEEDE